jgi:hypothetical protein
VDQTAWNVGWITTDQTPLSQLFSDESIFNNINLFLLIIRDFLYIIGATLNWKPKGLYYIIKQPKIFELVCTHTQCKHVKIFLISHADLTCYVKSVCIALGENGEAAFGGRGGGGMLGYSSACIFWIICL